MFPPSHEPASRDGQQVSSALEPVVDGLAARVDGARPDVSRIASTLFCSSAVDPSIVTFAKQRTALYWGLAEEEVDVQITVRLLTKTGRLMTDRHIQSADRMVHLAPAA